MTTPTDLREGRSQALLAEFQADERTEVSDFTAAKKLWITEPDVDFADALKATGPWMGEFNSEPEDGLFQAVADRPAGNVVMHVTPEATKVLLRNNWGPFAGGAFTLSNVVSEYLTLAWIEDQFGLGTSTRRLVRLRDTFFHRIALMADNNGYCFYSADYFASLSFEEALDTGGVTLPAIPVEDKKIYEGRSVILTRDPSGDNEVVPFDQLILALDQKGRQQWYTARGIEVYKQGKPEITLTITMSLGDEAWRVIDNLRSGGKQEYRIVLTASGSAEVLTFVIKSLTFGKPTSLGRRGKQGKKLVLVGTAGVKKADGSLVDVTLS